MRCPSLALVRRLGAFSNSRLAIAVSNPDGEQGQPNATPFLLKDNTAPILLANHAYYSTSATNDSLLLDLDGLNDGVSGSPTADNTFFQFVPSRGYEATTTAFGEAIIEVKLSEAVDVATLAGVQTTIIKNGLLPRAGSTIAGDNTGDFNNSDPNDLPTGSTANESDATSISVEIKGGTADDDTLAIKVDDIFTIDHGDFIDITGIADLAGNAASSAAHPDGAPAVAGGVIPLLDNTPPMVKSIATNDTAKTIIVTFTEKVNFSDWSFDSLAAGELANNPGFFTDNQQAFDLRNADGGNFGASFAEGRDQPFVTAAVVNADHTVVTLTVNEMSFIQENGDMFVRSVTDVDHAEGGAGRDTHNVNPSDRGQVAYAVLSGAPLLGMLGAYEPGPDGVGTDTNFRDVFAPAFYPHTKDRDPRGVAGAYSPHLMLDSLSNANGFPDRSLTRCHAGQVSTCDAATVPTGTGNTDTLVVHFTEPVVQALDLNGDGNCDSGIDGSDFNGNGTVDAFGVGTEGDCAAPSGMEFTQSPVNRWAVGAVSLGDDDRKGGTGSDADVAIALDIDGVFCAERTAAGCLVAHIVVSSALDDCWAFALTVEDAAPAIRVSNLRDAAGNQTTTTLRLELTAVDIDGDLVVGEDFGGADSIAREVDFRKPRSVRSSFE